ncbi:Arp2/3 complex subunit, actin nucleation center [Metarhizium acridum]|uniref:Arp2/3 complex subunit, actin nucleation center n=1 Tax=Metarhizium acridum TaxID=92637 RepID=UPI001C6C3D85|nr:Arp2/3 complex subunit, actin nucleation center [Metarhizium acridum]
MTASSTSIPRAQFFVAQHAYIHLRNGGRIILMSSVAANMSGIPNHALYAGSKAAVEGFTRSFAVDAVIRISLSMLSPPVASRQDMYDANAWHYVPGGKPGMPMEEIDKGLAAFCPLERVAVPQDIGRVVAFLAHPDSEWVNGQIILLTGGSIT